MATLTDSLNAAGSNAVPTSQAAIAAAQELAGRSGLTQLEAPTAFDARFADGLFYRADAGEGSAQVVTAFDLMATITRAGAAWTPNWSFRSGDPVGVLRESPANAIRYNAPPNTAGGALVETAAMTNLVRNAGADNATPGTIGGAGALPDNWSLRTTSGLTVAVVGQRVVNNWPGIVIRLNGTQTADFALAFDTATGMTVTHSSAYTSTFNAHVVAGALPAGVIPYSVIYEMTAAGADVTSSSKVLEAIDSTPRRYSHIQTLVGGATVARAQNSLYIARNGTDRTWDNVEIFIAAPNLTAGSSAGSPVFGVAGVTNASSTRATETITEGVTFTRASRGWASPWNYTNGGVAGPLQEYGNNAPRIGSWGFKREPASTNFIRNGGAYGAIVGTLGSGGALPTNWNFAYAGGNVDVVSVGEEQGWRCIILRIYGTFTGDNFLEFEGRTQIDRVNGETLCAQVGLRRVTGNIPAGFTKFVVDERTEAGGFVKFHTEEPTLVLDGVHRRFKTSETLDGGVNVAHAAPILYFANFGGAAVDFQIAIYCPQAEKSLYPTSYIPNEAGITNASPARAAEAMHVTIGATGFINQASTVAIEFRLGAATGLDYVLAIPNAGNSDYMAVYADATNVQVFAAEDGSIVESKAAGTHTGVGGVVRLAYTAGVNDFAASVGGQTQVTDATWVEPVDPPTKIHIGSSPFGGNDVHGDITALRIAGPRLSDSNIAALAA